MNSIDLEAIEGKYFPSGNFKVTATKGKDEVAQFVERRFYQMAVARNLWYNRVRRTFGLWDVFQDWLVEGENFNKAVRFPTLRDVANAIKNEILRTPPEASLEADMGEEPMKAQALEFRIKEIKDNIYEKRVQEDCIADMLFYGIGYRMVNFYEVFKKGDGELIKDFCNVGSERLDPTCVYWDEQGRYIYDNKRKDMKRDCIVQYTWPYSTFLALFKDREGFQNIESVQPYEGYSLATNQSSLTPKQTEEQGNKTDLVRCYLYMNQEDGFMCMVANGITIKAPCELPEHGRIPIVAYIFERRRDSFYPNSLAELIAPHIYAQDTIFNLELMGLKLDLMPATMIDSSLGYNPKVHKLSPQAVWSMNVPQGKDIRNMVYPFIRQKTDANGWQMMNGHIESGITITSGQDRRSLYLSPGELATQTAAKNQSMQRNINALVYSNELEAEGQLTELMVALVKEHVSEKVTMMRKGKKKERYRKVKVEGYDVIQNQNGSPIFTPSQGKASYFEFNEETADINVNVHVKPTRIKMLLQEAKVARLTQGIPVITNFINAGAQVDPEIVKKLDWNGIVEQWAEANDLDLKRTLKDVHSKIRDRVQLEHKAFISEIEVKVPVEETMEESERHLQEHLKLRFVYDKGRMTKRETKIWVDDMTEKAKALWSKHVADTVANIKKKLEEAVNQPMGDSGEYKEPMAPALPKQQIPAQVTPQASGQAPESDIASKTMLNRGL